MVNLYNVQPLNNTKIHINLEVYNEENYFIQTNREIDWDEDDDSKVSMAMNNAINNILALEASIYALRRATGVDGLQVDLMRSIRRKHIISYQSNFGEDYVSYNDYE